MYYNKQLYALKMSKEDTMANHINTCRTLIDNLASAGTSINDKDSAIILLGTLPESYGGLVVSISSQSNLTLESVTGLLLQKEIRRKSKGRVIEDKPQDLYSNEKPFKGNQRFLKRKSIDTNKISFLKKKDNCFRCGKLGYHLKDCRIHIQEEKTKSGSQVNSVSNTINCSWWP